MGSIIIRTKIFLNIVVEFCKIKKTLGLKNIGVNFTVNCVPGSYDEIFFRDGFKIYGILNCIQLFWIDAAAFKEKIKVFRNFIDERLR